MTSRATLRHPEGFRKVVKRFTYQSCCQGAQHAPLTTSWPRWAASFLSGHCEKGISCLTQSSPWGTWGNCHEYLMLILQDRYAYISRHSNLRTRCRLSRGALARFKPELISNERGQDDEICRATCGRKRKRPVRWRHAQRTNSKNISE